MTRYVKKPIPTDAFRWNGKNVKEMKEWMDSLQPEHDIALFVKRRAVTKTFFLNLIEDPEDDVTAALWVAANNSYLGITDGEWVMHDEHGFYPCKSEPDGSAPLNYVEEDNG